MANKYTPARYKLYSAFLEQCQHISTSALTADLVRSNTARTSTGALIIGDSIRDNSELLAEYNALKNLCDNTIKSWRNKYAASTVLRMITELKRHIVITTGLENNPVIAILGLDSTDSNAVKKHSIERANRTAQHRRPFYDVKGIIKIAEKMISSNSYLNITVGLVLLTGRRPSEIILSGKLTKTGEYTAIFSGQLKTKKDKKMTGKEGGNDRDKYEIPLLSKFDTVNNALEKLRAHKNLKKIIASMKESEGAMTLPQLINSRLARNCRKIARSNFLHRIPDFIDGHKTKPIRHLSTYTLRGVYAKINAMNTGLTDTTDASYIREILGHSFDQSLSTSAAYDHCYYAGATLPKSTIVKKSGVDTSKLDLKELDLESIQNAGDDHNIKPVKFAINSKQSIISKAKKLFNKLTFWR